MNISASTIHLVEDDTDLRELLKEFLQEQGFIVSSSPTGAKAIATISTLLPHLVILDLSLPDIPGEDVLRRVRKSSPDSKVIILTAKNSTAALTNTLSLGADDYLSKPFETAELLARIKARLRTLSTPKTYTLDNLHVDTATRSVTLDEQPVSLTKTEYNLLLYLLSNPNHVFSREAILNHVWGYTTDVESRVVDVYLGYLRKKIPLLQDYLQTVRGVGYMLKTKSD